MEALPRLAAQINYTAMHPLDASPGGPHKTKIKGTHTKPMWQDLIHKPINYCCKIYAKPYIQIGPIQNNTKDRTYTKTIEGPYAKRTTSAGPFKAPPLSRRCPRSLWLVIPSGGSMQTKKTQRRLNNVLLHHKP